ncbi:ferric-rhodotorulic acid/ferric-coprogen receptor FhuE [Erwinia rhapontici]|uniref:Ferric-rhodotorulic acid/ferric-coprogen receptor FhuE n=1 Tax=Erwinia rhapontici TaxID=55212 RepID=A0ABN6DDU3_ERWRD|nr:ferric-rhodotorulic acid/ferric-coprogen receptor FhuE [Erwinia rhapontici]BCQ32919.1 ferric-rhodotorulic acid/ferric-coprogen receptor FhuE [Erwinia rhapontici]BCQ42763.1 ferric-rhodotorulic acid/ferric-coprogen receptor FhuE [Erwinia rhapontici]
MSHSESRKQPHSAPLSASRIFTPSVAALLVMSALQPAFAADNAKTDTLTVEANVNATAQQDVTDYSVPVTSAGTKMPLTLRDIPQSVSIVSKQRMQDQGLQTVGEVLNNTVGVSASNIDSDRSNYYSRGFLINNYLFDGVPTVVTDVWDLGDARSDTAIYDRVEVIRGANSLALGSGNPSASINMVRKHADSKVLTGSLSAETGSWDKQRYVGDITVPLNESGTVRARAIGGYQENDTWLDRYHARKKFLTTVVDADLTDSTQLSLGWDYQSSSSEDPSWGGIPTFFSNGERTNFDRSFNSGADWTYSDKESNKFFATLTQQFDSGWQAQVSGSHTRTNFDTRLMYADGYPDKTTGTGSVLYSGWNKGRRTTDSADLYANGPFDLFGRTHQLMVGGSYSKQENTFFNSVSDLTGVNIGDYRNWNGNVTEGTWSPWTNSLADTIRQKSVYTAARFSLTDPLSLLVGARYTDWSANGTSGSNNSDKVAPYAGLTYDINDTYSVYASYTSIFQPQTSRSSDAKYLSPVTGKSYETGLKGDWNNSRLTATLSLFRTEQNGLGVNSYVYIPNTTEYAYDEVDAVSRGVEFEVNGALTDNWQMTFGASRYIAEQRNGTAVMPEVPRTTAKLFTSYRLPMLQDLTVGGGVNWQNKTWATVAGGPAGSDYIDQSPVTLVNLFSRYQVTRQVSVQANINNLFDKEYYDYMGTYVVYGAPRNFTISANYSF